MIEVVKAGLLTTIQDLGRTGYAHLGVGRSGAVDAPALALANRLVGNDDGAAGLETTLTGVTVRVGLATEIAVTGAAAPVTVDDEPVPFAAAVPVPAGAVVTVGAADRGVRSYLAFAGGITVAPVLGSRSTDTLSGLGPPPLRPGYAFPVGRPAAPPLPLESVAVRPAPAAESVTLRIRLGPRYDWLSVPGRESLLRTPYSLSPKSNRVGARLSGAPLTRAVTDELPSEGIVLGAVQVPADGQPLIFLADHPTTGGYPVVAVVEAADLPRLAQARPGTAVQFVAWT